MHFARRDLAEQPLRRAQQGHLLGRLGDVGAQGWTGDGDVNPPRRPALTRGRLLAPPLAGRRPSLPPGRPTLGARRSAIHGSVVAFRSVPRIAEQFITEHYWGYTARGERTSEYRIEHPRWKIWPADSFELKADIATLYGEKFVEPLKAKPVSAFIADGSYVEVQRRTTEP